LTITDTRTMDTDQSGKVIHQLLEDEGFEIIDYQICQDDIKSIQLIISHWVKKVDIDVIVTTGGTGISERDCTIEAVQPLINKELTGFGELFRFLSFMEDVGTRA